MTISADFEGFCHPVYFAAQALINAYLLMLDFVTIDARSATQVEVQRLHIFRSLWSLDLWRMGSLPKALTSVRTGRSVATRQLVHA
jgi:hypothetical protein